MATPSYQGEGQPLADTGTGWLGRLGGFFGGGGTPVYEGEGQPTQSLGFFGGGTPAYLPAPAVAANEAPIAVGEPYPTVMTCPIDPAALTEALAAGKIVIVIPRQGT